MCPVTGRYGGLRGGHRRRPQPRPGARRARPLRQPHGADRGRRPVRCRRSRRPARRPGALGRHTPLGPMGGVRRPVPASAAHARPRRTACRRGRAPSRLAPAAAGRPCAPGWAATPWEENAPAAAHVARAAALVVWSQTETGHTRPVSSTYAALPALRADDKLEAIWLPRLASRAYESGLRVPGEKLGCLAGIAVTERQGGSDVRASTTVARLEPSGPVEGGPTYRLTGQKWFVSAPMSDLFLVLAHAPGGLSCFARATRPGDGGPQQLAARPAQGHARPPLLRDRRGRARRHVGGARGRRGARSAHAARDGLGDCGWTACSWPAG